MSFICKNTDCSAPENKKGKVYPSAMECPFCDAPLVEVLSFNEADLKLINALPYVIAYPLKRAIAEKHAWTKINLLKDTFLNYLKYFGLITASEFFNSSLKDKKMVALFQQALAEPSFGSWNQYIRETLNYLKENNHHFFCPDLLAYYELVETSKKRKLFKGEIEFIDGNGDVQLKKQEATAIGMLINFRNRYLGHGLTLDEAAAKKLWDEYYPIFSLLLEQLNFAHIYPMFKHEHGETYRLQSAELITIEKGAQASAKVWMENPEGKIMDILPFFVVPGELSIGKADKEQILAYESYTGKTIKFFSPEGTEKQTSGKILEKLNLLLRDKQKESPFTPEAFTKDEFLKRIAEENKLLLDTLIAEKKIIPGVYQHREEIEIKLREWIGARANIFFIAAEAGSGKTNLLIEMQMQYAAQNLPVLFIRAARMEKSSLKSQIGYLLNIQPELGIEHYSSIAGTQANPTFIFIDGLNEATQAEILWQEIIDISKKSIPGSLKFVVSSRANTSADLNGYILTASDEVYLYGKKKEGHTGLSAHAFWLTALNMAEMKSAWEAYGQTNKNNYKPQFSFDDLANFDRSIYNLISNPLVLRIFLETYHNKSLHKKGNKHLNIWQDWLATFSESEISFFKQLAQAVWEKGENELLLDELLNNPKLKPFLTSDLINAPYPRLKNLGWISRYTKDFNACLSFTVEGSLLYLMGSQLNEQTVRNDFDVVKSILTTGKKIQQSSVELYLSQLALAGDLALVCKLIDAGDEYHYACNAAMLIFLRSYGVKLFVEKVFSEPTENDWLAMLMLNKTLNDLQEQLLRKEFLSFVSKCLAFTSKYQILIALKAIDLLDYDDAILLYQRIQTNDNIKFDSELLYEFAICENKFDNKESCLDILIKSINDHTFSYLNSKQVFNHFYEISKVYSEIGDVDKAYEYLGLIFDQANYHWNELDLSYAYNLKGYIGTSIDGFYKNIKNIEDILFNYNKALEIRLKILGANHPDTALSYNNIAYLHLITGQNDLALKYFLECLNINLKVLDPYHTNLAMVYNNLGVTYSRLKKYSLAIEYLAMVLEIKEKRLGKEHRELTIAYNNLAQVLFNDSKYNEALINFENCLNIELKFRGDGHPIVATIYYNIGNCYKELKQFENAIEVYNKALDFVTSGMAALRYMNHKSFREYSDFHGNFYFSMAESHEGTGNTLTSLDLFIKSAEIRNADFEAGPEDESTKESIQNTIRIAKLIGKENELPEWIKKHNLWNL